MRPGLENGAAEALERPERRLVGRSLARSRGQSAGRPRQTATANPQYPELDCVRHLLSPGTLDWAEQRAARLGVGADRAVITAGILDDETYIRALAAHLNIEFEPLETRQRSRCLLSDAEMIDKAASGLLPIADETGISTSIVLAPAAPGRAG